MTKERELIELLLESGIDQNEIQHKIEDMKNKQYLAQHELKIWQGDNGYWYTYLTDDTGKRKLTKRKNKEDLEKLVINHYKDKKDHTFYSRFLIWKDRQQNCGVVDSTLLRYDQIYKRFFEKETIHTMLVEDINEDYIEQFIGRTLKNFDIKYEALHKMFCVLRGVLKKCYMDKLIPNNPCDFIDLPSYKRKCKPARYDDTKRVLKNDDCKLLMSKLKEWYEENPNDIIPLCMEFTLLTGLRAGELAYLKWDHINKKEHTILIDGSQKLNQATREYYDHKTKTGEERAIPLTENVEELLDRIKTIEMRNGWLTEYVFSNKNGRINRNTFSSDFRNKCAKAGLKAKGPQVLRRTYNSMLKSMGVSTLMAASLLGHDPTTNEKYYTYDVATNQEKSTVVEDYNKMISAM